jgi:hypothetical protein
MAMNAHAKSILLETSPYETDGGHMIGRDPRKIAANEFDVAGILGQPILSVLRAKCLDCSAGQTEGIRKCVSVACALWPYRMATNPFRAVNVTPEELGRRRERGRALAEARRSQDRG